MHPLIAEHLEALRSDGYSEQTITLAASWLSKLEAFAGERDLAELGVNDLEQWRRELIWTPGPRGALYAANTVNQAVGAVRRFYRFLVIRGDILSNPTVPLTTTKPKVTKPVFSVTDRKRILASVELDTPQGIRNRALLGVLLETRMPQAVCSRLSLGDLCLDTAALLASGRIQQIHSLSDGLLADLERYLEESRPLLVAQDKPSQALFLNFRGERLSVPAVRHIWRRHTSFSS